MKSGVKVNYIEHLIKNWKVAFRSLYMFAMHFLQSGGTARNR